MNKRKLRLLRAQKSSEKSLDCMTKLKKYKFGNQGKIIKLCLLKKSGNTHFFSCEMKAQMVYIRDYI